MIVSDASLHSLTEYSYTTTGNAVAQVGTFTFPADPAGGAISPQEVVFDANGNMWTTSAGGTVKEWCTASAGCTNPSGGATIGVGQVMQTVTVPTPDGLPRGIVVDSHTATTTIYVTTSSYGALTDNVYDFTLTGAGLANPLAGYSGLVGNTVSTQETGQLRGITYDKAGNVYYADSTWAASGTNTGYVNENTGTTAVVSGLAGPNELLTGNGTIGSGSVSSSCDVLYVANYYGGTIQEISTGITSGGFQFNNDGCGDTSGGNQHVDSTSGTYLTLASTNISGIALAFGDGGVAGGG